MEQHPTDRELEALCHYSSGQRDSAIVHTKEGELWRAEVTAQVYLAQRTVRVSSVAYRVDRTTTQAITGEDVSEFLVGASHVLHADQQFVPYSKRRFVPQIVQRMKTIIDQKLKQEGECAAQWDEPLIYGRPLDDYSGRRLENEMLLSRYFPQDDLQIGLEVVQGPEEHGNAVVSLFARKGPTLFDAYCARVENEHSPHLIAIDLGKRRIEQLVADL